jgi:hypothetical protein
VLYFQEESKSFVLFKAAGALLSSRNSILCFVSSSRCFTFKMKVNPLFCFKQPVLYFKGENQSFVLFQAAGALL